VDSGTLLAALDNDKLTVTLAALLAARVAARAARTGESERAAAAMPHQTA
jgi:membrane protein